MRHLITCAIALSFSFICAAAPPPAGAAPRPPDSACPSAPTRSALPAPAPSVGSNSAAPVELRVIGGGEDSRRVRAQLRAQIADDPRLALGESRGGLRLDVRLDSSFAGHLGRSVLRCSAQQSIIERASQALRASATQRGTVTLSPSPDAQTVQQARTLCFEAIVPAVVEGLRDYVEQTAR